MLCKGRILTHICVGPCNYQPVISKHVGMAARNGPILLQAVASMPETSVTFGKLNRVYMLYLPIVTHVCLFFSYPYFTKYTDKKLY